MLDCVLGERKALLHVSETIMIIKKDYYYFFYNNQHQSYFGHAYKILVELLTITV